MPVKTQLATPMHTYNPRADALKGAPNQASQHTPKTITLLHLCSRLEREKAELLAALELCAGKLAMWPEGSNPEFFPSLKAARAAIARATQS